MLEAVGARYRLLKGVALAHQLYSDPWLRQFADVDLLIAAEDLDRAVAALQAGGVSRTLPQLRDGFDRRFAKGVDMRAESKVEVDIHRTLAMGWFGKMMRPQDLFGPADYVEIAGRRLPALSLEDAFVHAGMHAVLGSEHIRLSNARDIAELCLDPRVDTAAVEDRAMSWRCSHVLASSISRVSALFGIDLGRWNDWALHHQADAEQLARIGDYRREDGKVDQILLGQVLAIDGVRQRARYVASIVAPSGENLAARDLTRGAHLRQMRSGLVNAASKLRP